MLPEAPGAGGVPGPPQERFAVPDVSADRAVTRALCSPLRYFAPDLSPPPGTSAELSLNTAGFAKSTAMLGSAEDNTALSRALSQLAEVEDKMELLHQDQAANDTFGFAEVIADYIRLLGAVRVLSRIRWHIFPSNSKITKKNKKNNPPPEPCVCLCPAGVV